MGDPLTIIQYASAAFSVIGTLQQSRAVAKAEKYQQLQIEQNKRLNTIKALQQENDTLIAADQTRGENLVLAYKSGYVPLSSPSWLALRDENERIRDQNIENIRILGAAYDANASIALTASRTAASDATNSGYINAAGTILGSAKDIYTTTSGSTVDLTGGVGISGVDLTGGFGGSSGVDLTGGF